MNVEKDLGRQFLLLIDKIFHKKHPLRKIFNRNNVKLSYRTTPNLASLISSHNKKILNEKPEEELECNCRTKSECPMHGKCRSKCIVYQAKIVAEDNQIEDETYLGICSTEFKARWANHKSSFKNRSKESSCKLAQYIWKLKDKGTKNKIDWKIICKASPYSSVSNVCNLCINEKYYILYKPEMGTLNSRKELTNNCRHRTAQLIDKG